LRADKLLAGGQIYVTNLVRVRNISGLERFDEKKISFK
jgi:hypothetical protein